MPDPDQSTIGTCLREARKAAGYTSVGQASTHVHLSPETVGRHERGDIKLLPEDAIHYAETYRRPDILVHYCDGCAIHEALYGRERLCERDLPWNAMRISRRLRKSAYYAERLEAILDDGLIDDDELPELEDILQFLQDIDIARREMLAVSMSLGIIHNAKKTASTDMDTVKRARFQPTHSIKTGSSEMAHVYCTTTIMGLSK